MSKMIVYIIKLFTAAGGAIILFFLAQTSLQDSKGIILNMGVKIHGAGKSAFN